MVQLLIGVISNLSADEDQSRILIPFWLPLAFFIVSIITIVCVTFMGMINLRVRDLLQVVARMHFNLRLAITENNQSCEESYEAMKDNAELLTSILKIDPNVANLLGIPITPRLMTTIWTELLFGILVITQFLLTRMGDRTLITIYFNPALEEVGNY